MTGQEVRVYGEEDNAGFSGKGACPFTLNVQKVVHLVNRTDTESDGLLENEQFPIFNADGS